MLLHCCGCLILSVLGTRTLGITVFLRCCEFLQEQTQGAAFSVDAKVHTRSQSGEVSYTESRVAMCLDTPSSDLGLGFLGPLFV